MKCALLMRWSCCKHLISSEIIVLNEKVQQAIFGLKHCMENYKNLPYFSKGLNNIQQPHTSAILCVKRRHPCSQDSLPWLPCCFSVTMLISKWINNSQETAPCWVICSCLCFLQMLTQANSVWVLVFQNNAFSVFDKLCLTLVLTSSHDIKNALHNCFKLGYYSLSKNLCI